MKPYDSPTLSDFYTLTQSTLLENQNLHSEKFLYTPYLAVKTQSPHPGCGVHNYRQVVSTYFSFFFFISLSQYKVSEWWILPGHWPMGVPRVEQPWQGVFHLETVVVRFWKDKHKT